MLKSASAAAQPQRSGEAHGPRRRQHAPNSAAKGGRRSKVTDAFVEPCGKSPTQRASADSVVSAVLGLLRHTVERPARTLRPVL